MCLEVKKQRKLQAKTDKICYKHVILNKTTGLFTPYQLFPVNIGSTYTSEFSFDVDGDIEKGLHSFKKIKDCIADAKQEIKNLTNRLVENDYLICKCLIPAGSSYYCGKFCQADSFASDKIIYLEVIKTIKY